MKEPVYALWAQDPPVTPDGDTPNPLLLCIFLEQQKAEQECAKLAAMKTNQLNGITFYVESFPVEQ